MQKIKCELPEGQGRIETGILEINDDWPGVFIRGDNAFHYVVHLLSFIKTHNNSDNDIQSCISKNSALELARLLTDCIQGPVKEELQTTISTMWDMQGLMVEQDDETT